MYYRCDIYWLSPAAYFVFMRQSAAVLCHDKKSLQTLRTSLEDLGIEPVLCQSNQEALEFVMAGECTALIVDFDLAGAEEAIRMANLLPASQKPALIAVASRAWPGTGQAFHSGANRILYRPLESESVREALKTTRKAKTNRRKAKRYDAKTLVYLELEGRTIAGVSIDIGEQGLALQATEPVPMSSNVEFRCVLPGTDQSRARPRRCDVGRRSRARGVVLLETLSRGAQAAQTLARETSPDETQCATCCLRMMRMLNLHHRRKKFRQKPSVRPSAASSFLAMLSFP